MMSNNAVYSIDKVGVFTPKMQDVDALYPGEVGFITASIKSVSDCSIGDTITDNKLPCAEPLKEFLNRQFLLCFARFFRWTAASMIT